MRGCDQSFIRSYQESFKEEWQFHPCRSEEFYEFLDPIKPVLIPTVSCTNNFHPAFFRWNSITGGAAWPPICPTSVQASASSGMRRLYSAENRRRSDFDLTSGSTLAGVSFPAVGIDEVF